MKNIRKLPPEPVNSNEIISDYDFYVQVMLEEKALDFEIEKTGKRHVKN